MELISVYIVEDDPEIRSGLSMILDNSVVTCCLGAAGDAESALQDPRAATAEVVLMDISLPGMSGIECVRRLKQANPNLDILMLTVHDDDQAIFQSLCAGACGYLTKNTPSDKLLEAIREVHAGGAPLSTNIARMVVSSFRQQEWTGLTCREQQVLDLLCEGNSYKMLAAALFISQDTVRSHIKNIYRKLQVNSKTEAVAKALKVRLNR